MTYLRKIILPALLILLPALLKAQQDPQFSQYMFNPLSVNPAYAGSRGVLNGALVYRNQWVSFPGAPQTQVLAANAPLRKGKVGLGIEFIRDEIGPKKSTAAYMSYAYRFRLGRGKLALGLGAGVINYRVNWDQISYKDQADVYAQLPGQSQVLPDFKFGAYFNNKKFFMGLSSTHINNPSYVSYVNDSVAGKARLHNHLFFTIGRAFALGENFTFSPSLMARSVVNMKIPSVDLNLNFRYKELMWVGLSLRSENSLILMAQYSINEKLNVGYSYDMTFGRLRTYQSGTHELMLGFNLNVFQSEVMSPRYF